MIIGLSGKAGTGKDTVANILVDEFGYKRVAFGDKVKECLLALDPMIVYEEENSSHISYEKLSRLVVLEGWDAIKQSSEVRRLLQRMGTEVGREILGMSTWTSGILPILYPEENIVITDVRFWNETLLCHLVWRIERDISAVNSHSSETELDDWEFDKVISNNGTMEELAISVREAMKWTQQCK